MPTLDFDREKSNLGGINEFAFIFESELSSEIEIIKGQVVNIEISVPGFTIAQIVQESGKFSEDIKSLNLFEYKFIARIASDNYNKLLDCGLFDTNKIIALVKDNNKNTRVLGNKYNACELKLTFDKGTSVADLNHYQIELKWLSKFRAPILSGAYIVPIYLQDENAEFIAPEDSIADNKLSSMDEAETIENGFSYIILPNPDIPGTFISYKYKPSDFMQMGADGKSAYEIAVLNGFVGTEQEWLDFLKGADGEPGPQGPQGLPGQNGNDGDDGLSAYEIAVVNGFSGTVEQWLESLIGSDGAPGQPGEDGAVGPQGAKGDKGDTGDVGNISDYTTKDNLNDNDLFLFEDSEIASPKTKKKTTWTNIKDKIKTFLQGVALTFSQLITVSTFKISSLTSKILGTDSSGNVIGYDTQESNFYVGDFTGNFAGLATESNWIDNVSSLVSGQLGDRAIGIGAIGAIYECFYSQYGWVRDYVNPYITDATLIAALTTSGNWTKVSDTIFYYNAASGDRDQKYYLNGYNYECINGSAHTWIRTGNLDTIEVSDLTYIPKPQVEAGKGIGDIISIVAKHEIVAIVAESETTTAGNITIGRTATNEVSSLSISSACSVNGNCQVVLDGVTFNVALTTSQNTATLVATAIRAASFISGSQIWTTGGSGTTVIFTSNKYKSSSDSSYSANGTGANGTMTTTTQGVDPNNDVVTSTALSTIIGNKKNLSVLKNVDYPSSNAQNIYINIDSVATVKLQFILQKLFE